MIKFKPAAWLLMDGTIISEYSYNLRKLKEEGDIPLFTQRTWVGLMKGVRVEGDTVVISTKDNDAARELCGALIEEMNK